MSCNSATLRFCSLRLGSSSVTAADGTASLGRNASDSRAADRPTAAQRAGSGVGVVAESADFEAVLAESAVCIDVGVVPLP